MEDQSRQIEESDNGALPAAPANAAVLHDYVTRQQLAEEFGLHPKTLERWEKRRTGPPCTRVGNTIYYHVPAVREWLADRAEQRNGARAARQKGGRRR